MPRVRGGFGSAGAGNRTLRHTATAVGVGPTARVLGYAQLKRSKPARPGWPDEDVFHSFLAAENCWWCLLGPFKSLGMHWQRAHGFDLAEIRDYYLLPKHFAFVSEDTHEKLHDRSVRLWVPGKLAATAGNKKKRSLSPAGIAVQREKGRAVLEKYGTHEFMAYVSSHLVRQPPKPRACVVCGKEYVRRYRQTCSPECLLERRRQIGRGAVQYIRPAFIGWTDQERDNHMGIARQLLSAEAPSLAVGVSGA